MREQLPLEEKSASKSPLWPKKCVYATAVALTSQHQWCHQGVVVNEASRPENTNRRHPDSLSHTFKGRSAPRAWPIGPHAESYYTPTPLPARLKPLQQLVFVSSGLNYFRKIKPKPSIEKLRGVHYILLPWRTETLLQNQPIITSFHSKFPAFALPLKMKVARTRNCVLTILEWQTYTKECLTVEMCPQDFIHPF